MIRIIFLFLFLKEKKRKEKGKKQLVYNARQKFHICIIQ